MYDIWGFTFDADKGWYRLVSILLIFYQVVLINRLAEFNNLTYVNTLLPGVGYVLVLSLVPEIHPLSPHLVGNTFVLIAVGQLFQSIHRNQRSKRIFNTGFNLMIAVMFDLSFLYYIPFFIIAANAIILVRVRDIVLYLMGTLAPVYFLLAYWKISDQFVQGFQNLGLKFRLFEYSFVYEEYGIIKAGIIGLLAVLLLLVINRVVTRTNIFVRNKLTFLFYMMILSAAAFGLSFHTQLTDLQLLILPVGILMGLFLVTIKRVRIAESIHFFLLIIAVLFQYFLN